MAITTTEFDNAKTKERTGLVPSVYEGIVQIGASDTPILSMIGSENVTNISHSWHIDTLREPKNDAKPELYEYAKDTPKSSVQKNFNAVQKHISQYEITDTQEAVKTYGGVDQENYLRGKTAKEHALDIEFSFFGLGNNPSDAKTDVFSEPHIRNAQTDPGKSAGIFHFLAKGADAFDKGWRGNICAFDTSNDWQGQASDLTWDKLMLALENIWKKGETPRTLFVGSKLKHKINKFVSDFGSRVTNNKDKGFAPTISTLDTDFGVVEVRLHRFLSEQYGLGDVLLAGNFEYMKNGLLISTTHKPYETGRTSKGFAFHTESTLIVRNADAFVIGVGLK
ncbi:DUF5309 family protein [Helicobacter sp.]|uniref:SU10 major capsid protein n=1 Tax=Helicobacter sp. TaxID=218 RepID=UPI0025C3B37D|nr:DUF5309 family protein [Helicobacter sp.]MCI5968169.1 DUF5309 domain-containing protein [Helicobacter sp.]